MVWSSKIDEGAIVKKSKIIIKLNLNFQKVGELKPKTYVGREINISIS